MNSNRASSHQELIPPSPGRNRNHLSSSGTTQHAFGSDSDDDQNNNSDSDDDGLGFNVYKDQPSNARYVNVASPPITPNGQPSVSMPQAQQALAPGSLRNQSRTQLQQPPMYNYPPEDQPPQAPIKHSNPVYRPNPSDLVHMPELGSDWQKDESKRDKDWEGKDALINKTKWLNRKDKLLTKKADVDHRFKDFVAGRRNLGGWFNRFMALALLLFLLLIATLLSYFLVPRIPEVAYNNETPFTGDSTEGLSFQALEPVRFEFNGQINLAMMAKQSYVKPKTSHITVIIKDLSSSGSPVEVGRGTNSKTLAISTKEYTPFTVDLKLRYSASSGKDPVWTAWHEACGHKWPGKEDRPKLQIGVIVEWGLQGRIGTFSERTIINDFACPVELPANAA